MKLKISKEKGNKKVQLCKNKLEFEFKVMRNGYQWTGFPVDDDLLYLMKQAIDDYFDTLLKDRVKEIVDKLKKHAENIIKDIENGDCYQYHVSDEVFSKLVNPGTEHLIIEAMVRSGEWDRGSEGFFLKKEDIHC